MKLKPLHDRVVIERLEESEQKSSGGIIIPDTAKEKPQRGKVVAVGDGAYNDKGDRNKLDVRVGDEVLFGKYSGNDVKIDGIEYLIMRENEILAVIANGKV
ncbi:co-chaperone GroES [Candidatus Poribacteria bacterium]|nr:co-chaperone GroES [Candidatus Poribacteria bacterium]